MNGFINTVDVIGDEALINSFIDGSITEYKDNKVTTIRENCISYLNSLTIVELPKVTTVGDSNFVFCPALLTVILPQITVVYSNTLYNCEALATVDFSNVTNIYGDFSGCNALTTLILRGERVVSLSKSAAFSSTPIASGTGYIYVPRALIEDGYKTATNWTRYQNQYRALEDFTVDGTITGALDTTKI